MHNLKKEVIINSLTSYPLTLLQAGGTAATTAANTAVINWAGFARINKADIDSVSLHRPVAGVAAVKQMAAGTDLTIGTITEAGSLIFKFKLVSSKHEAMYHRFRQEFGREPVSFQVRVNTTDTDDTIVEKLYKAMYQRASLYPDDLPFTVTQTGTTGAGNYVLILTGKTGYEHVTFTLDETTLKSIDDSTELSYVTLAQLSTTTAAVVPILDGYWVEQNIAMNTHAILSPYAEKKADIVDESATYSNMVINTDVTSNEVAAPAQVGTDSYTARSVVNLYYKDSLIQATPDDDTTAIGLLLSVMFAETVDGAYATSGASVATKTLWLA
jgi:hypothetical protein